MMAHRPLAGATVCLLVLGACASAPDSSSGPSATSPAISAAPSATPGPDAAELTAYDSAAPLDVREESDVETTEAGIAVHDVSWASPGGGRVSAWLVVPAGAGPFAGLVYLHGSETDRDDFLDEALAMAHGGAVSLVLDAPFARRGDSRRNLVAAFDEPDAERDMTAQAIVDTRRAYDLLAARADVDPARLGFVGHSWGASLGLVLAAVDPRPAALVLLSGRPSWTGFLATSDEAWVMNRRDAVGDAGWQAYLDTMAPLDAMAEASAVEPSRLYLQYGTQDEVVPEEVANQLVDAIPGVAVDWYAAEHALDAQATADRVAWLVEMLALDPIPPAALAEVGLPDE
jgi:dienelactone hydrolase